MQDNQRIYEEKIAQEEADIEAGKTTREKLDREKARAREKEEKNRDKAQENEGLNDLPDEALKTELM
jgi:hypothetical protein